MISFMTIFGAMALGGGSIGYFTFPMGLTAAIKSQINLKENGMVFPTYMDPPFATRSEFRLFAIKNPREVLRGAKMELEMKGPYVFRTRLERDNIAFKERGEIVKYDSHRKLVFLPEESADADEKMWLLNPILPSTLKTVRSMILDKVPFSRISEPVVLNGVNVLLDQFKERLITKTTPRKLLEGRKVELLESISGLASRFSLQSLMPPGPPNNTFGIVFVQNETVDVLEIWAGTGKTVSKFGDVHKWNDKSKLTVWKGKCNIINGTNGELYKPFVEEGRPMKVFIPPLCRTLSVDPVGDGMVMTKNGINAYEYELTPRLFMGVRSNPNNRCFCEDSRSYDCQFDGLMAMGPCFFDSPIYFSRSIFSNADPRIKRTVDDKSITREVPAKQSFYIEPITGAVLKANLSLMGVVKFIRQPYMRDLAKVQNLTYAPLFVTTETAEVPFSAVWQVYVLQIINDHYKQIMAGTALGGSALLLLKYLFG